MPRGVKKENLPSKICVVCDRPFTWRKKWERCWDEVTTCSKACNSQRRRGGGGGRAHSKAADTEQLDAPPLPGEKSKKKGKGGGKGGGSASGRASATPPTSQLADTTALTVGGGRHPPGEKEEPEMLEGVGPQGLSSLLDSPVSLSSTPLDSENTDVVLLPVTNSIDGGAGEGSTMKSAKEARKDARKASKALKRLQREGKAPTSAGQKPCTKCAKSSDLLVRCQIDQGGTWHLVCGKCWKEVSGGVVDGDEKHPHYRYGGLWKNRVVKQNETKRRTAADSLHVLEY